MAKPLVKIAIQTEADDFGKQHIIMQPDNMFVLTYEGKPVVIKTQNELAEGAKYQRTAFAQEGTAVNLAKKMNKIFNTDQFDYKTI
tara:strand:- start:4875 stop:5132 length:258 start_codon:yes stop_codon:yes gene_type:complete